MKKISRRAFLSVMAAAGAAAALTACGGSSGSSTAASGSASVGGSQPGGHKLTAYAWDKNFNIPALNAAAADYKENVDPEFELEVIEQSGAGDVENAITLAGSAHDYSNLPDIVQFQDHYIQRYVSDYPDAFVPMEGADVDWDGFGKEKLSYSIVDGVHYGVPVDNSTVIFAYRTDLLEQVGKTIDDIISFISVFPLLWMISAATNTSLDVARGKIMFGTYAMQNFKNLLASQNLAGAMGNSFLYAIVQTVISMFVCSLAGFGFELYHDKNKDRLFSILLLAMMVPQVATMVPLFKMMSRAGLLNSVWAFILPSISTPFLIMMFRQNSRNFPNDLMQAARIDGLSETGIFFRMYVPIMKSTYAAAAVITFMNAWNAYMWPKVVMTDNRAQTMPMLIANIASGYSIDYGMLMMGVLFCSIPTMIVFFVLQKQFAEGITGAVK